MIGNRVEGPMGFSRNFKTARVLSVRPLERADLERLRGKAQVSHLAKLRDIHMIMANLLVAGLNKREIARETGYSEARVHQICDSPAMIELVSKRRAERDSAAGELRDERYETMLRVQHKALRHVEEAFDRADDDNEIVPIQRALAVVTDLSDRIGYVKKSVNVNLNVDFANRLEAARRRSAQARVIDAQVAPAA